MELYWARAVQAPTNICFSICKISLTYLGPEIVRALLADSQSNALTPSRLLRLSKNLPHDWKEQRCFLGFAA